MASGGFVQAQDVITRVRNITGEITQNRWTDTDLLGLLSDAQTRIATDLIDCDAPWPTASKPIQGQPSVGRYAIFPCLRVLRVYLQVPSISTQLLPGTDIPTLEGDTLLIYDSTSDNLTGAPTMTPEWLAASAQNYPLTGRLGQGGQITNTGPYQDPTINPDTPPQCAVDGGNIIIVPPPSNTVFSLLIDHVPLPPDFVQTGDYAMFPQNFRDALMYDVARRMSISDHRDSQAVLYEQSYSGAYLQSGIPGGELGKLVSWRNNFQGNKPKRMAIIPPRARLDWDTSV